jgi:transposase
MMRQPFLSVLGNEGRERDGMAVLADHQWSVLEPLLNEARPWAARPIRHFRRTIEAIVWRQQNGAKWRAIPAELGPWWMAAQTFIRWAKLGVWERLHRLVQAQRGLELGMVFLDGTVIRAHQKAAGARKQDRTPAASAEAQALGRSRGGYGTKGHVLADAGGRAIAFVITPGQAAELLQAEELLGFLPGTPVWTVADRGYSSHALRQAIGDLGSIPAIPTRKNEAPVACRAWIYANRERVERLWSRLKEWRAGATRYDKTARSFLGVLSLAATFDWIRR